MVNLLALVKHEAVETKHAALEIYHFVRTHNWKATLRFVFQRKYWKWWILLVVVIILSAVLSGYHEQISLAIRPFKYKIATSWWAWIIPVVVLVIVSFPPLFGHELILIVSGLLWGTWRGFAIACAGTFIGELGCYYAFRYFFKKHARKLEDSHVIYACCAKMMRDGGLPMLVLVRFSAMPGHIVTAIQSCIGIGIWYYGVAAFLTLPKQFALVYIGKVLGDSAPPILPPGESPTEEQKAAEAAGKATQKRVSIIVLFATIVATAIAAYIVWMRARALRPQVLAEMEARRIAREEEAAEAAAQGSTPRTRATSTLLRKQHGLHIDLDDKPPEFADLIKWEASKGSLRTPMAQRESAIGMSLNSPSLPHLPKYTSRIVDGDELLLAGRPRAGTASSRVSAVGSTSARAETPDYFTTRESSPNRVVEADEDDDEEDEEAKLVGVDYARRRSEPNWQKRDWE